MIPRKRRRHPRIESARRTGCVSAWGLAKQVGAAIKLRNFRARHLWQGDRNRRVDEFDFSWCNRVLRPNHKQERIPNVFEAVSTASDAIFHLSVLVLAVTDLSFGLVFSMLTHAILRFRRRSSDQGEPSQVCGTNELEVTRTVMPFVVAPILFLVGPRAALVPLAQNAIPPRSPKSKSTQRWPRSSLVIS